MADADRTIPNPPDLREALPGDKSTQNFLLQHQFITEFDSDSVPNIPDGDRLPNTRGLDILIQVVRLLYSVLSPAYTWPDQYEMAIGEERTNPLLKLAWADLGEDGGPDTHVGRYNALKVLFPDGNLQDKDLSFKSLADHNLMYETLWKRRPLLLFSPSLVMRNADAQVWKQHEYTNHTKLAHESLVKYDGALSLGDDITKMCGHMKHTTTGAKYIWSSNDPAIIRVHYRENKGQSDAWKKLAIITVNCRKLVKNHDTGKWVLREADPSHVRRYRLIGYVVMGEGEEKGTDVFRSYLPDGKAIPPQIHFEGSNSNVVLGEAGKSYMLLYLHRTSNGLGDDVFPEIYRDNVVVHNKMTALANALEDADEQVEALQSQMRSALERVSGKVSTQANTDPSGSSQGGR
ncbi:hypothetical protein HD806DRAFT_547989 [Xylariaceae sp. AK1471]|nr:hypothetical protein HD806DRAFT_547989 [Xylariaceae sp. AK1471]